MTNQKNEYVDIKETFTDYLYSKVLIMLSIKAPHFVAKNLKFINFYVVLA